MSEHQAWLTRIAIYFGVWCAADIVAVFVRFGAFTSPASAPVLLIASVQLVALLIFLRRDGTRSDTRGLVLAVLVANLGIAAGSFWSKAAYSRAWLSLTIVFALVALLTTSALLRRTSIRPA